MSFNHASYRNYIKELLEKRPRRGHGELQKISEHIKVHSTLLSQIMSGNRDLTEEQAYDLCDYFELTEVEIEYFLLLLKVERSSTQRFKKYNYQKLENFREETKKVSKRYFKDEQLSDQSKSIFYSSWIYSAIRIYCSTREEGRSLEQVIEYFKINRTKALEILNFLVENGLCELKNELYLVGQKRTAIDRGSIYYLKNHLNWRLKSIERSENLQEDEKFYTAILSLSEKDYQEVCKKIEDLVKSIVQISQQTEPEKIICFNCDFFKVF